MDAVDAVDAVDALARLFAEHPAWRAAASHVTDPEARSDVYFSDRPGEAWHLELADGAARLLPDRSPDPDFVFRFAPGAVLRLSEVEGGLADFAIALFEAMQSDDPATRVDLRVAAPFSRLLARGYVGLLAAAGPRLVALGARRGFLGLRGLRRMVEQARRTRPEDWEVGAD